MTDTATTTFSSPVKLRALTTGSLRGRRLSYGQPFTLPATTAAERADIAQVVLVGSAELLEEPDWWDRQAVSFRAGTMIIGAGGLPIVRPREFFEERGDTNGARRHTAERFADGREASVVGTPPAWWAAAARVYGPQFTVLPHPRIR